MKRSGSALLRLVAIVMLFACLVAAPCSSLAAKLHAYSQTHRAMGTIYTVVLYARNQQQANVVAQAAFDEVDRIDALLSNYQESSELSRINRAAASQQVVTDPETFNFLRTSLDWSEQTRGAFDITVGQLMKTWGFFRSSGHVPNQSELEAVRSMVGWHKVQLDPAHRGVRFLEPGISLDPGGIGKGYAVDRMLALLRAQHISAALLSAGSSTIYALGAPPGMQGWKVRIPDPVHARQTLATVTLRDTSLSTSACSEKFFILAGHRYCHIMDPRTLRPVEGMLQTSAIDASATASDTLSAALFVLGPERSAELLRHRPESAALIFEGTSEITRCVALQWPRTRLPRSCASHVNYQGEH